MLKGIPCHQFQQVLKIQRVLGENCASPIPTCLHVCKLIQRVLRDMKCLDTLCIQTYDRPRVLFVDEQTVQRIIFRFYEWKIGHRWCLFKWDGWWSLYEQTACHLFALEALFAQGFSVLVSSTQILGCRTCWLTNQISNLEDFRILIIIFGGNRREMLLHFKCTM